MEQARLLLKYQRCPPFTGNPATIASGVWTLVSNKANYSGVSLEHFSSCNYALWVRGRKIVIVYLRPK